MGRLQRLAGPRIIRGPPQAFMRTTVIWAAIVFEAGPLQQYPKDMDATTLQSLHPTSSG
jgi:hypothetical protein